jgi:hypothetical protein
VNQLLVEEPDEDTIGPFKASDPNMVQIKMQTAVYIPFELMPLMLGIYLDG